MMRQSSSRNNRSRGWKVKNVFQICILAIVCVWLLYQVRHSNERKKSSEELIPKNLEEAEESRQESLKLGRKDPQQKTMTLPTDGLVHTDDEEIEEPDDKHDDRDDDMDEIEHDRSDVEDEDGEGAVDDEEKDSRLSEIDQEEIDKKSQVAREDHYKGDDVSSAVTKDNQEEALEFNDKQRSTREDGDKVHESSPHAYNSLQKHELEIGPPSNSTAVPLSAPFIEHQQENIAPGNSISYKQYNQSDLRNSTVLNPVHDTALDNSTLSKSVNQSDLGNFTVFERGNQLADLVSSNRSGFVDRIQLGNSSRLTSLLNDTQSSDLSAEAQSLGNRTVTDNEFSSLKIPAPAVDQSKTAQVHGESEADHGAPANLSTLPEAKKQVNESMAAE